MGICWVLVLSVGCECTIRLVHKAWFDDEFFVQPLVIYTEKSSRNVIWILAPALHMLPASQVYDQCSCAAYSLGSIAQAPTLKIPFIYQLIYPYYYYWLCLYAIWRIFLVDKCQCAQFPLCDVRHNETQSATAAFKLWGKRSRRNFVVLNTPIFLTIATFEFEVLALLGNSWRLSRILFDDGGHATMAGLHPLSHFSALSGCCWYFVWLNIFHYLFLCNNSPLIAVVMW